MNKKSRHKKIKRLAQEMAAEITSGDDKKRMAVHLKMRSMSVQTSMAIIARAKFLSRR